MIHGDLLPWNQHFLGQEFVLVGWRRGASVSLLPGWPPLGLGISTGATDQGSLVEVSVACSFDDWIMAQSTRLHDSLDISEAKVAKPAVPFQEGLLRDSQVLVGLSHHTGIQGLDISLLSLDSGELDKGKVAFIARAGEGSLCKVDHHRVGLNLNLWNQWLVFLLQLLGREQPHFTCWDMKGSQFQLNNLAIDLNVPSDNSSASNGHSLSQAFQNSACLWGVSFKVIPEGGHTQGGSGVHNGNQIIIKASQQSKRSK